jgi:adenine-specific DNA-methyltransferase
VGRKAEGAVIVRHPDVRSTVSTADCYHVAALFCALQLMVSGQLCAATKFALPAPAGTLRRAMIKYLGSKRLLVPHIVAAVAALPEVRTVVDLFSGTSRVGHALKARGYRVLSNDHCAYAAVLARCYVQADRDDVVAAAARELEHLAAVAPAPGWFTRTFAEEGRYLQPRNAARIEAIRRAIAARAHPPELEAVLLTSLLEAADRVDSTTGVQMAFLKRWSARSANDLELRLPAVLPRAAAGKGEAYERDALEAAHLLAGDVAYVDPPYNQHSYLGNYHVWETLVRFDAPEVYGVAKKRVDCRVRRSAFNSRRQAPQAFAALLGAVRARHLVVSFSDEGHFAPQQVAAMLAGRGRVWALGCDYPRYVGARIGIYNPRGVKVGAVSHVRNREFLFVASDDRRAGTRLRAAGFRPAAEALATGS